MFQGVYNGSQKHPNDLDVVLERSWQTGLDKIIITVGTLSDVKDAAEIARKNGNSIDHYHCFAPIKRNYHIVCL